MPYSLKGRNILVTGGSRGLGALVCEKFAQEGSNVAINYVSSKDRAEEVAKKAEGYGVKAICIQADAGKAEDNVRMMKEAVEKLGGIDVIVANAGWTRFSDYADLNDLSLDEWNLCWSTNVMQHIQLLQIAQPIFEKNADGGVYLMTSSVAGITTTGSSMGYSVTKAAGLQLMRCLAATQAPKLRVNAILPGLLLTEWGLRYSEEKQTMLKNKAVLKKAVDLEDCANTFIDIAKNSSMTGQEIVVDSGLKTGMR